MYPYRYVVSLRIHHPTVQPDKITKQLGLQPRHSWMAGQPRSGPKGNILKGINKETYWTARLHKEKSLRSRKLSLEDFLTNQIASLNKSKRHLRHIRKTGGRIGFFVGLFCNKNSGAELPSSLLTSMGDLGIDLALDIYPE